MRLSQKFSYMFIVLLLLATFGCSSVAKVPSSAQQQSPAPAAPASQVAPVTDIPVQSQSTTNDKKLRIAILDVGQADSILVQIPNGKNLLIDAGNNEDAATIITYLQKLGINKLDILIGTHPHEDHIGSLDTVIEKFAVGQIVMPPVTTTTDAFRDVIKAIAAKGQKITKAEGGLVLDLGSEVSALLLAPNSRIYEDLNNYSAVVKINYGQNSFLFAGDAQELSELEMVQAGYDLKSDLIKVGHHGSQTSSSEIFLAKVQPKYAVISVGKGNRYGHPSQETLDRLARFGAEVYRTDQSGTIIAESDGTNIDIHPLLN
jgi:beta-lactamase superfamily II metal-dependent hydrolase